MNWKYFGKLHTFFYRLSGGRLGYNMGPMKCVLVEVRGRKTGKLRHVPIVCYPYNDSVLVSASNSGMERHPAWYYNLKANPECTIWLGRDRFQVVAEELPVAEADAFLPTMFEMNPHQQEYREGTERKIPLIWFRKK